MTTAPSATDAAVARIIVNSQAAVTPAPTSIMAAKRIRRNFPFSAPLPSKAKRQGILPGAKFRRADSSVGSYNLSIKGRYPCADEPGLGLQPVPSQTGVSNPTVVSACAQNSIIPNSAAWSGYAVNSYLSSLLSAAAPAPTAPQVDAGRLLTTDTGQSSECTYDNSKSRSHLCNRGSGADDECYIACASIVCKDMRGSDFGNDLLAQRFLAYTAYINFSNFFYSMWDSLFNAAVLGIGSIDDITVKFFTDPTPQATWEQILGLLTPLLTIVSTVLGPLGSAVTALGGVVGETIAAGNIADLAPVIDQRFSE